MLSKSKKVQFRHILSVLKWFLEYHKDENVACTYRHIGLPKNKFTSMNRIQVVFDQTYYPW